MLKMMLKLCTEKPFNKSTRIVFSNMSGQGENEV